MRWLLGLLSLLASVGCAPIDRSGEIVMRVDSQFEPLAVGRMIEEINGARPGARVALELSSPGGYLLDGLAVIAAINEARRRGVTVVTRVRAGSRCASMCVFVFAAGHEREAEPGATFLLHGARNLRTGEMADWATMILLEEIGRRGANYQLLSAAMAQGMFGASDHILTASEMPRIGIELRRVGARGSAAGRPDWTHPAE